MSALVADPQTVAANFTKRGEGDEVMAGIVDGGGLDTGNVLHHKTEQLPTTTLAEIFSRFAAPQVQGEREFFIDNLLARVHFIIVMIRWTDPQVIDYLSLDVEGAEHLVLAGLLSFTSI